MFPFLTWCNLVTVHTLDLPLLDRLNILANHPRISGQSRKLTSHPAVPEAFKIVLEIVHMASTYTKSTFDRDRMLVGQDQC